MASSVQEAIPPTRSYQQEMLEASLKQNVVIALDTGSGKTHIAILRMKIECDREANKLSWFIAPTVGLCEQQRDVIRACLPVPVGLISGALQPDQWTDEGLWRDAVSSHRIIVSTPQVLLDALRHGYVNLSRDVGLLVFDEAHHAADKHPYNMIMREFYDHCTPREASKPTADDVRPFILGLTASPAFGGNINKAFRKIEENLDSVILAPRATRDELAKYVHRPVFKKIVYQPLSYKTDWERSANVLALADVVESLDIQVDPLVISLRNQLSAATDPVKLARIDQRLSQAIDKCDTFVNKGMRDFLRTAKELCIDLGPWAADWYVYSVVKKALKADADAIRLLFAERHQKEKEYLIQVLQRIKLIDVEYDSKTITRGCSHKTNDLIAYLLHDKREWEAQGEIFSCIIFITRRDGALALSELLRHHPCTSAFFTLGTLLGSSESNKRNAFLDITRTMLPEKQNSVLAGFRIGEMNLVVSTAVAEEGIDVQACCSVFRWDLPQNMVSWAQSRGRARRKQSTFVLMFEDGGTHEQEIMRFEALEREMIQKYNEDRQRLNVQSRHEGRDKEEGGDEDDEDIELMVESTGAKVTLHSAISHVAHFCNTLRSVVRNNIQPIYDISPPDYATGYHSLEPSQRRKETLPQYAGPYGATLTLPRLIPPKYRIYSTEERHKSKQAARRHVAFNAYVGLYRAGLLNINLLPLHSSIAHFQDEEVQSLLDDVEKREGLVNVSQELNPWTTMLLGNHENVKASDWWLNEVIVEGVGKFRMFTHWQIPELDFSSDVLHDPESGPRSFSIRPVGPASLTLYQVTAAKHFTRILFAAFYGGKLKWDDIDYAYLFLPSLDDVDPDDVWEDRRAWAASVQKHTKFARDHVTVQAAQFGNKYNHPTNIFLLVNRHSFFKFKRWRFDNLSPAEEEAIRKKYHRLKDLDITYPVLEAEPFQARTNFLLSSQTTKSSRESVLLLPQLTTVALDSRRNIMLGLFLPSMLRSLFIKLIVSNFREWLLQSTPSLQTVSLDLVQNALMTPAADTQLNYERLETLGDAVLKLITSLQLFAEHPAWPEGFLSRRKDLAVSNAHLAKVAVGKQLYKWIIRRAFIAKKWTPDYASTVEESALSDTAGDTSVDDEEDVDEGHAKGVDDAENILIKLSTKTLADVVESLIGASFLSGGYDKSIAFVQSFAVDIGSSWKPVSERFDDILEAIAPLSLSYLASPCVYLESIIDYEFTHKKLLLEALLHSSSQSDIESVSYERLEFLGDAVLDAIIVEELYRAEIGGKTFSPAELHTRKACIVNMHLLAFVCLRAKTTLDSSIPRWDAKLKQAIPTTERHSARLANCILHSSSSILDELRDAFIRYERGQSEIEFALEHGSTFPWSALARLQAPKFLGDVIESILGAVYLDSRGDMDTVKGVLEKLGIMKVLHRLVNDDIDLSHPVSRLSMLVGKNRKTDCIEYKMVQRYGNLTCTLVVEGEEVATMTIRYNGKASEDDVRYRVAEVGMPILVRKYTPAV